MRSAFIIKCTTSLEYCIFKSCGAGKKEFLAEIVISFYAVFREVESYIVDVAAFPNEQQQLDCYGIGKLDFEK